MKLRDAVCSSFCITVMLNIRGGETFCADNKGLKWTASGTEIGSEVQCIVLPVY